jgi:pimeloyl-ACP methyl ester carboxylesterase
MIYEMRAGEFDRFAQAMQPLFRIAHGISLGDYCAVQCSEEGFFGSPGAIDAASAGVHPLIKAHFGDGAKAELATCAAWGLPPADPLENQAVVSDIPTLIFAGRYDPITPPAWGLATAKNLSRAFYLEFPSAAHGALGHPCAQVIAYNFFIDPTVEPSQGCLEELRGLSFALP